MSDERNTFSPFWHRVRTMRARLRPHVQITRQRYRGQRWHVVHDPASNQFFRLNPISHEFVGLLDGKRTVEQVWELVLARHGDDAPTQHDVLGLLSQLFQSNLLSTDAAPEAEELLRRGRERRKKKVLSQAMGIMYFKIRLFNPDRLLTTIEPLLRPLIGRVGFLAWLVFVGWALVQLVPHWEQLVSGVGSVLAPSNWIWLGIVFVVTKLIHEMGHGLVCKSLGLRTRGRGDAKASDIGQVPEMGVMLLVLFPAPFVDATSAWSLPSKWQRVAVGGAGMIFELAIAAVAALVWLNTQSGELVHQIAYNAIITASVSTIIFNANPLMRFDGYYMLSDLLETPNLMSRSNDQLKFFFQKYVYRLENLKPPARDASERVLFYTYGLAALAYRMFLFISISLYVMGQMFAIGLLLAIWTAVMWFVIPIGKLVHWLGAGPQVAESRGRAITATIAMIAVAAACVGLVPVPDWRRASGVVEAVQQGEVYTGWDGFVRQVMVTPGERVLEGQMLMKLSSPDLEHEIGFTRAQVAEVEAYARQVLSEDEARGAVAVSKARAQRARLRTLEDRLAMLEVRAPNDGVFVGPDPQNYVGRFLERGALVGEVVSDDRVRVAAVLSQREAAWHFDVGTENYNVEIRRMSDPATVLTGRGVTVVEAGQTRLPHGALGITGGGTIETTGEDPRATKDPNFVMRVNELLLASGEPALLGTPGERVKLRFTLPWKPIAVQFVDRMHKLIQGRVRL